MATLKRSDSKTLKELPPRSCVVCCDTGIPLIRPCRSCASDYCEDCLTNMFVDAIDDRTRMPPRCCNLIQLHTVINLLGRDVLFHYRKGFEEWITPNKTYCPSQKCSAFISENKVPSSEPTPPEVSKSLSDVLSDIITSLIKSPSSRFFRADPTIDILNGYTNVPLDFIHLGTVKDKIAGNVYRSTNDLTKDMKLIVTNSQKFIGDKHSVTRTAEELFSMYLTKLSQLTDRLIRSSSTESIPPFFPCPTCHIAICSSCKQIEHSGSPCSTSDADHEIAMLAQFGYKRCPRCKAGVKKMYGCSHMQCLCGAHWCYYCQKSLNECDGTCEERRLEEEDEDEDSDSDEEPDRQEALANQPPAIQAGPNPGAGNVTALNIPNINDGTTHAGTASNTPAANPPAVYTPTHPPTAPTALPAHPTPMVVNRVVNLDAGGGHRWAEGDYNFGEEPEEEPYSQVWSCQHKFDVFQAATDDGFNHGDYSRMECNRCFEKVQINRKGAPKSVKKRRRLFNGRGEQVSGAMEDSREASQEASQEAVSEENEAHECPMCKIIVCVRCKEKFIEERIV